MQLPPPVDARRAPPRTRRWRRRAPVARVSQLDDELGLGGLGVGNCDDAGARSRSPPSPAHDPVRRGAGGLAADPARLVRRWLGPSAARRGPRPASCWPRASGAASTASMAAIESVRSSSNAASSCSSRSSSGSRPSTSAPHRGQLVARTGRVGLQRGHDTGVEQLAPVPLERTTTLVDQGPQAPRPLAELLDLTQPVGDVLRASCGQLGAHGHDVGVQLGQLRFQGRLGRRRVELGGCDRGRASCATRRSPDRPRTPAARSARRSGRRGDGRPRPDAPTGGAGDGPHAAGPGPAAGWPRCCRGDARPSPCACGT